MSHSFRWPKRACRALLMPDGLLSCFFFECHSFNRVESIGAFSVERLTCEDLFDSLCAVTETSRFAKLNSPIPSASWRLSMERLQRTGFRRIGDGTALVTKNDVGLSVILDKQQGIF